MKTFLSAAALAVALPAVANAQTAPAPAPNPAPAPAPTEMKCCCKDMTKPMDCCPKHGARDGHSDAPADPHAGHNMSH